MACRTARGLDRFARATAASASIIAVGATVAIATLATVATAPLATAAPRERITWADWVGDWRGTIAWTHCTTAGARSATLPIDAHDGALSIDLTPAGRALGRMSLVQEDDGSLAARDTDLAIAVRRRDANSIALVVAYDSGCTAKASLSRTSTRVLACDRFVGWARIERTCTKDDRGAAGATREPAPLPARWRPSDAASCLARSERMELALIDAGCAPHPDGALAIRSRDCSALAQAAAALRRCGSVPPPLRDRLVNQAHAIVSASHAADRASLGVVERQCRDARSEIASVATRFGCP